MGRGTGVRTAMSSPGVIFESSVPGTQSTGPHPSLARENTGLELCVPLLVHRDTQRWQHHTIPSTRNSPTPRGWARCSAAGWARGRCSELSTGPAESLGLPWARLWAHTPCSGSPQAAPHVQRPCAGGPYSEVLCWEQSHQELRSVCWKPVLFYTTHSP